MCLLLLLYSMLSQLRDPQSQSAVGKRLNFFKTRAKKSLTSIESLWGKVSTEVCNFKNI